MKDQEPRHSTELLVLKNATIIYGICGQLRKSFSKQPCEWSHTNGFFLCQPRCIYHSVTVLLLEISAMQRFHERVSFINSLCSSYFMALLFVELIHISPINKKVIWFFLKGEQGTGKDLKNYMVHNIDRSNRKSWGGKKPISWRWDAAHWPFWKGDVSGLYVKMKFW